MSEHVRDYDIHLDDKFGQLAAIDLDREAAAHEPWFNQTLTTVNDSVVRLGVLDGEFHWHRHEHDDEFFLVLDGELEIDESGLERFDRELIAAVALKFGGGPVGLSTLAVALGEEAETIEDVYEPYLLQLGLLQRTPRGRVLTELGREQVGAAREASTLF